MAALYPAPSDLRTWRTLTLRLLTFGPGAFGPSDLSPLDLQTWCLRTFTPDPFGPLDLPNCRLRTFGPVAFGPPDLSPLDLRTCCLWTCCLRTFRPSDLGTITQRTRCITTPLDLARRLRTRRLQNFRPGAFEPDVFGTSDPLFSNPAPSELWTRCLGLPPGTCGKTTMIRVTIRIRKSN